jgi:hypothetical protein
MTPTPDAFEVAYRTRRGLVLRSKWDLTYETPYGTVIVPAGTLTDGASIPRIFWPLLGPHGPYFLAAVLHDYAYSAIGQRDLGDLGWDRYMADMAFDYAMELDGVNFPTRLVVVSAVRMAGWVPYNLTKKRLARGDLEPRF